MWRWNRAIYDPASGGHLRIEMRALPAGPTMVDMLANAAFLIGLSLWVAGQDQQWTYALPFERADHGFYRAAQHGLSAQLTWPAWHETRYGPLALPNSSANWCRRRDRGYSRPAWQRPRWTRCST